MPVKKPGKVTRQALIVLGMHRAGTSAISGVLVKLGAQAPKSLMPPTVDNPRGYWESTALMQFHDRILESAGSRWSDWDKFNPGWIDSPSGEDFLVELSSLLEDEFGDARLILVKDPRMCRLFPLWSTALTKLEIKPKVVIPLRHPAEVARSLGVRDQLTANQSKLIWLRHMLDAEYSTRGMARVFIRYTDLLRDWQSEMDKISGRLDIKWPRYSGAVKAEVEGYLAPDLRHHAVVDSALSGNSGIAAWVAGAYKAIDSLIDDPEHAEALVALDGIRREFDATSEIYSPIVNEQRQQLEQKIEGRDSKIETLSGELKDLSHKHELLRQENLANYQLYDDDHKALSELRKHHEEREAAFTAMISKHEVMQSEMNSRIKAKESVCADMAAQLEASEAACNSLRTDLTAKLEHLEAAYAELDSNHRNALAEAVTSLNAEIRELKEANRLAEESVQERFLETAELTKSVFELENEIAGRNTQLEEAGRIISRNEKSIRSLQDTMDESNSMIRALECEIDAQQQLVSEYRSSLETIHSSKYWRVATALRSIGKPRSGGSATADDMPDDEVLRRSKLFDRDWYIKRYPDVKSRGMDPIKHYLKYGAKEGRDPCAAFHTTSYVSRYPDVASAGINPLVHYLKHGRREGRIISSKDQKVDDGR